MKKLDTLQVSSLEKVYGDCSRFDRTEELYVLRGEEFSYQIVCTGETDDFFERGTLTIEAQTDIDADINITRVQNVPVGMASFPDHFDDDYLTKEPGYLPDALIPIENNMLEFVSGIPHVLWVNVKPHENAACGTHKISVKLTDNTGTQAEENILIHISEKTLSEQKLIFTQWFHTDCIADVHNVKIFSPAHWKLIEKYIDKATQNGVNMILTPVFTPPLDTARGGERPCVQLVDIYKNKNGYSFDFKKLKRFVNICLRHGIKYFEIAHLFTQWGADATPNIMAHTDDGYKRIFGWDVTADSCEYKQFLSAFIPAIVEFFEKLNLKDRLYFHISDEPEKKHKEAYTYAKSVVAPLVGDCKIIDALSDYEFYSEGIVENPVVGIDFIHDFLNHGVKPWAYYCCAHTNEVSNRFIAMPSHRNRVLGIIMYKYDIEGFLHWGYNFYNSFLSKEKINPYLVTDAKLNLPSGDAFSVYPYEDGVAESLRIKVFYEGLQDMRALYALEEEIGREKVIKLIDDLAGMDITFKQYPHSADYILSLRKAVYSLLSNGQE